MAVAGSYFKIQWRYLIAVVVYGSEESYMWICFVFKCERSTWGFSIKVYGGEAQE